MQFRPMWVCLWLLARRGVAALFFVGTTAAQAALSVGVTPGASVEGVTEYTLDNGLKVLLFPDATKPKTTVNVTYLVGSRHENYGETGHGAPARAHGVQGHAAAAATS